MNQALETEVIHTPETLTNIFANLLIGKSQANVLQLSGIYRQHSQIPYQDYFFDRLHDEVGEYEITLRLHQTIRQVLEYDQRCIFKGYLNKQVRKEGRIDLVFNVVELISQAQRKSPNDLERKIGIYRQKVSRGYRDVTRALKQKLLKDEKVKLAIIYGHTSIVDSDILAALESAESYFEINNHRVNLASIDELIVLLQKLDQSKYDVITIARGGGAGVEVFENLNLAHTIANLSTLLITAIGHAEDKPFVQEVADKSFTTPTLLGVYLRTVAEDVIKESTEKSGVSSAVDENQRHIEQLKVLNQQFQADLTYEREQTRQLNHQFTNRVSKLEAENQQLQSALTLKPQERSHQADKSTLFIYTGFASIIGIVIGVFFTQLL